ncbi:MAG: cytochrome c-type biogenesis protein [Chromatocurvus sp.]
MTLHRSGLIFILLFFAIPVSAVIETYEFSDPALEERYHALSEELRCPKCQNQNIAGSNAPISEDLRRLLHRQLEAGATDGEILEDMVDRYGDFVRYRPAFDAKTAVLWLAPPGFLIIGALFAFVVLRGRHKGREGALNEDERTRLDQLLGAEAEREG